MSEATAVAIVVVAAGSSSRFGSDKLRAPLAGSSVLGRSVAAVRAGFPVAPVALVVRPEQVGAASTEWVTADVRVVAGGARRQDSVRLGVEALDLADDAVVIIHDGARPFVPPADVRSVAAAAAAEGAAVLVAPVVDTVKRVSAAGTILATVPREELARALTPQAFRVGVLRRAWRAAGTGAWTDESALVEGSGAAVRAVPGDARNRKVTTPEDLAMLGPLFQPVFRTGQGVDVHPFSPQRPLWLCGVLIPEGPGLDGHSDADVALHAVTDAILGACGAGDIGQHFPPTDARWKDAPSSRFVDHAVDLARAAGFRIANCDLTLLLEAPRIAPHRGAMSARLAELLAVDVRAVNVKATTSEGLGFVGRREGAAAFAIVTLEAIAPSRAPR